MKYTIIIAFLLYPYAMSAHADPITKDSVQHHLETITQFYNGATIDRDGLMKFSEQYAAPDAIFKMELHVNDDVKPQKVEYNTKKFLEITDKTAKNAYELKAKFELLNFEVAKDDISSATVTYHFWQEGTVRSEDEKSGQIAVVPFKSLSYCTEKLKLENGIIRGHGSECIIDISHPKPMYEQKKI